MASLAALLSAYVMHPGDIVYVDTGTYHRGQEHRPGAEDSGITIDGVPAREVTLDRGNTNTGSYVFELAGATSVTIANLGSPAATTGSTATRARRARA